MRGQAKRFVNQDGDSYDMEMTTPKKLGGSVGFFGLWRYATAPEKALTILGVLISWFSSAGLIAAVVIYGELTALFVARHRAVESTGQARILTWFGGGRDVPAGNRTLHMDALVEDSIAFAWASVAVMLVQFSAAAIAVTLANNAASTMISRVRWRLLATVIRQEAGFFDTNTTMNFAATLTEDMDKVRSGVGEHVVMTSYLCGTVCLGAGLSLAYGWSLTLAALSVVPLAVAVATIVTKYQTKCSTKEASLYGAAGRVVEEALANIRTVRAYGGEQLEVDRYVSALKPAARQSVRRGVLAGAGAGAGWLLTYTINAIVFGYGAVLVVRDMDLPPELQQYHPGVMLTILFCSFMAAQNIAMCHPHLEVFSAARGAAKNLYKLLERKSNIDALLDKGDKPTKFRGDIEFKDVYFNYPSRPDVKVLRGLNLSIRAGETVALVGGSGCGKSTALQLLQRLYEPESGDVTVDGRPLDTLHLHHYRSSIGVVGQEPVLFSGTIRDNISIGRGDVTLDDVIDAAKTAHAHQFITKLADGYDTVLGDRGAQLSGGQKQRIAIARAVLRRPALLLLDEPTSALDAAAEGHVQRALDAAARGRTTLVVSHRLSTIVNASRIVYMSQGAVLEQGTHSELLAARGAYWTLVQEDLTNKSISNALSSITDRDDDDVVLPSPTAAEVAPLHRDFLRRSSKAFRGSRRLGSVSSARGAMLPVQDTDVLTEEVSTDADADADVAPVSWIQIMKLNAPEWPLLVGGGVASFLIGLTMPIFALLFSKFYGMFASSPPSEIVSQSAVYAGVFGAVAALCGLVTAAQTWMFNAAGARLTDRLRGRTFGNYLKQEQGWFDLSRNSVGALCARLATDCAAVQGATGTRLGTVLQGVSTLVIGVGLALAYSWNMTLVSLCSVPFVIGGIYLEGWVTKRTEILETNALEQASKVATEAVLNVRTVQSLGIEHELLSRYRCALSSAGGAGGASGASRLVRGAVYGLCLSAPTLGYAVSLAYGGYLIAREGLPLENAILVSEALVYGAWMLAEALSFAPSFAAAKRSAARILHALSRTPTVHTHPDAHLTSGWQPKGEISFSNIHFKYPTRPHVEVLKGLNLSLKAGHTVALVGPSGCGKSTLMQLLLRSYDADEGVVRMDGVDITRDVSVPELRAACGLVQQEPALFARSLRDNIAYGDNTREVPLEEIIEAAKQANIHNFIASLPNGYDTELGGVGAALSGGQKQRVCIARALVRRPRVLLLDEATSALDANSEKVVQAALEKASEGRTTLIIAHRLATIQHAHTICLIDKGVVCEQGTHEELVRLKGKYWDLLQQQAPSAMS